jgi:predicted nucleotidyltransferase
MSVKRIEDIDLAQNQYKALSELRERLFSEFEVEGLILYGSVVRGEADEESDIDLLIITPMPLTRPARHKITDMVFEVNLHHDTNFSTLVVDHNSWTSGVMSVLPLHDEIHAEGIAL